MIVLGDAVTVVGTKVVTGEAVEGAAVVGAVKGSADVVFVDDV